MHDINIVTSAQKTVEPFAHRHVTCTIGHTLTKVCMHIHFSQACVKFLWSKYGTDPLLMFPEDTSPGRSNVSYKHSTRHGTC